MKNRRVFLISSAFLLLATLAAVFFYFEVRETLELVQSEQAVSNEFSRLVESQPAVKNIPFSDIVANWQNHVIIDVREPEEFAEGRIMGALHYRLGELLNDYQLGQELVQKTTGKTRVFYCHDGDRSRLAATIIYNEFDGINYIMEKGFKQIQGNDKHMAYWEGSTNILPQEENFKRTPSLKWKDVEVNTLIDLSLQKKPPVRQLKGKTIVHTPVLLMSKAQIDAFINSLGVEPIVAMCNSKVSCFSTRILRYRLEEKNMALSGFVRLKETKVH